MTEKTASKAKAVFRKLMNELDAQYTTCISCGCMLHRAFVKPDLALCDCCKWAEGDDCKDRD